jgi:hypothetical protein
MEVVRHCAVRKNCEPFVGGKLPNLPYQQSKDGTIVQASAAIGGARSD